MHLNYFVLRLIVIVALLASGGCGNDSTNDTTAVSNKSAIPDNNDNGNESADESTDLSEQDTPNVLFIAIDDLNDWTSALMGHPDVKTPNLTRLAAMGIEFTNAHTPSPTCVAGRASVMTGIRPSTSGVYANQNRPWRRNSLLKDAVTIPQYFTKNGYYALASGKIEHASGSPKLDTWDEYHSTDPSRIVEKIKSLAVLIGITKKPKKPMQWDWGPLDVDFGDMKDGKVANWAIEKLQHSFERPFFLGVGLTSPHLPWYAPREYFEMNPLDQVKLPKVIEGDLDDLPPMARRIAERTTHFGKLIKSQEGQWHEVVQGYLATISFLDDAIGRILDSLESSKHKSNTIIVLWSDNGVHLGTKNHWQKWDLWEEATRVPLIVVVPGLATAGRKTDVPVNLIDIYPTLIELAGLPAKSGLEGTSLVPWLLNPELEKENPSITTRNQNSHSIRSKMWRYTHYNDGTEELYDHRNDPHEWHNLANEPVHADKKRELAKWLPTINAEPSPPPVNSGHLN